MDKSTWREALRKHQKRYPEMRALDAYKLVYQVLNGPEHALSDLDEAREMLLSELAEVTAPPAGLEETLTETISPRGAPVTVLRVHLRPFHTLGLDSEKLLTALVETSLLLPSREAEPIETVWPALLPVLIDELKFPAEEVEAVAREVELGRFPPVHHSAPYRRAYVPRYRITARRALYRQFGEELA